MRENAQAVRNLEICEPWLLLFLVSYVSLALNPIAIAPKPSYYCIIQQGSSAEQLQKT